MRLHFSKKIGQSGYELMLAVFFSFFIHAAVVAFALFLYMAVTPKVKVPPFYQVKLVGLPAEPQAAPVQETAPPARKEEAPPAQPKAKRAEPKPAKAAPTKGAMPEFTRQKPKPEKPEMARTEQAAAPSAPVAPPARPGGKAEGVAVSAGPEDFKFPYYLENIRNQIERNWNPPPVAKGTKAKVEFTILRSGRVFGDARLQESSGNTIFDLAAVRAILSSSPFPPMPEDFYRDRAVFTVDLTE